jgi:hypothetical protein
MTRRVENIPGREEVQRELTGWLRDLPQRDLPCDLAAMVLTRIRTGRRASLWRRWADWLRTPRVITVRPLPALSVTVAVVLMLVAGTVTFRAQAPPVVGDRKSGDLVPVVLELAYPDASGVAVIGSFNGWKPEGYAMHPQPGADHWVIEIKIPAGAYEYAFLVDGHKVVADPGATFYKKDGFGSRNAVLYAEFNGQNIF